MVPAWSVQLNELDAHDKDDDMRNFVGGGKNSGMMTVNPKDKQVDEIFKKAQESFGAKSADGSLRGCQSTETSRTPCPAFLRNWVWCRNRRKEGSPSRGEDNHHFLERCVLWFVG
jgi:hypothetical protein